MKNRKVQARVFPASMAIAVFSNLLLLSLGQQEPVSGTIGPENRNEYWYPIALPTTLLENFQLENLTHHYQSGELQEAVSAARALLVKNLNESLVGETDPVLQSLEVRSSLLILMESGNWEEIQALEPALVESGIPGVQSLLSALDDAYIPQFALGIPAEVQTLDSLIGSVRALQRSSQTHPGNAMTQALIQLNQTIVDQKPQSPYAWLSLGLLYQSQENHQLALDAFRQALSRDNNLTQAHLWISQSLLSLDQEIAARASAQRAVNTRPWDTRARDWLSSFPVIVATGSTPVQGSVPLERMLQATVPLAPHLPAGIQSQRVRVGLAEGVETFHIKMGGNYRIFQSDNQVLHLGQTNELLRLSRLGTGSLRVERFVDSNQSTKGRQGFQSVLESPHQSLFIEYEQPQSTTLFFSVSFGTGYFFAGQEDRSYRGRLEFRNFPRGLSIINHIPLEEYLYSVVPSEMPASWPMAALEAQAIAARSYTLANLGRFENRGFDLLATVASAFYRGTGGEHPRSLQAVDNTRNQVLWQNNRPLGAVYSANHGGYSESSESVWGFRSSLQAVPDPMLENRETPLSPAALMDWILDPPQTYAGLAPYSQAAAYRWQLLVCREELEIRNRERLPEGSRILGLSTRGRGISGRVNAVELSMETGETVTIRGDALRSQLGGLRSNLFVVIPMVLSGEQGTVPEYYLFLGAGWGHGVGLCQTSAASLASAGWSAQAILDHFYPATEILTLEP